VQTIETTTLHIIIYAGYIFQLCFSEWLYQ